MQDRYDIAIIGSGPAGLSAAINAKIRNKNIIVFGIKDLSNKLIKAPKVDNYLGFYNLTGNELKEEFENHINKMDIQIKYERINAVYAMGEYFSLSSYEGSYEAKSVIIASGMEYNKELPGEEEFLGRGVGYCATCDAPLYKGKVVTIIGYNKEAEEETNFVSEICHKVYYVPMYKGSYNLNNNVEVIMDRPLEIIGDTKAKKLKLKNCEIDTDGVFLLKDCVSPSQLVPGLNMDGEHIMVDKFMGTNIEGCFAAGDCVGRPYQYLKAAGEGQVAALSAVAYLDKK